MNPTDLGLLIDDDELYVRTLQRSLSRRGLETRTATGIAEALRVAEEIRPAFALVDLRLGEDSGLTLIRPLRALRADMRILLVTGYASVATAVEAIKRGADDYLPKPATAPMILRTLGLVKPESVTIETTMTPLHRLEWEHIHQALHETGGNVSAAARLLGMHRRSLQRKLAKKTGAGTRSDRRLICAGATHLYNTPCAGATYRRTPCTPPGASAPLGKPCIYPDGGRFLPGNATMCRMLDGYQADRMDVAA